MATTSDYENAARGIQSAKEPSQIMGMDIITLPANGDMTVTYEPDYDMNFETFRAPDAFGPSVSIVAMKVGPISVMAGGGPFPLDAFKGNSTLKLALAVPITQKAPLKVTYRNMTGTSIGGFYCGIVGKVKRAS
jgi:hypothetical protein